MTMIRKQLYLEKGQDEKLKRLARIRGVTEAEVVREAIEALPDDEAPKAGHSEGFLRFLEIANKRRATLPLSNGGRTWTRDDLYDERPKYLSR